MLTNQMIKVPTYSEINGENSLPQDKDTHIQRKQCRMQCIIRIDNEKVKLPTMQSVAIQAFCRGLPLTPVPLPTT